MPNKMQTLTSNSPEDTTCDADFQVALNHLFGRKALHSICVHAKNQTKDENWPDGDKNDWTALEEIKIKAQIESFISNQRLGECTNNDGNVLRFPTGPGIKNAN